MVTRSRSSSTQRTTTEKASRNKFLDSIGRPQDTDDFWVEGWRWISGELAFERPSQT